jgi:hypothetical protein
MFHANRAKTGNNIKTSRFNMISKNPLNQTIQYPKIHQFLALNKQNLSPDSCGGKTIAG